MIMRKYTSQTHTGTVYNVCVLSILNEGEEWQGTRREHSENELTEILFC